MNKLVAYVGVIAAMTIAMSTIGPAFAARATVFPSGCCFYEDTVVRTVVNSGAIPHEGRDPFYAFPGSAASGQMPVVAVAPGDKDYHGGQWKFFAVTFNGGVTPYLLTSAQAIIDAEDAGDVTITRVPENDFRCPIQK